MDYDSTSIPDTYDAARDLGAAKKARLLDFFSRNLPGNEVANIVDLGCGTARFSAILAEAFDARVVGVDPSQKMLERARDKTSDTRISFESGSGERLPFDPGSVDLVFMSMVLHHLADPEKVARECGRVLRGGGYVFIRNTVADEIPSYPYLEFFPSIRSIIENGLISRVRLNAIFRAAGFERTAQETARHEIAPDWRAFADKISLKADSFVARLADEEFKTGLAALRAHAENAAADEDVGVNVDSIIFRRK